MRSKEDAPKSGDPEFIREQYIQYHEMKRQLNAFSWQLPSVGVVVVLIFAGLSPDTIEVWRKNPIVPTLGFAVLTVFLLVLLVFHIRNLAFLRRYETVLGALEARHGEPHDVYAHQVDAAFKWWQRSHSSRLLGYLLGVMVVICAVLFVSFGRQII